MIDLLNDMRELINYDIKCNKEDLADRYAIAYLFKKYSKEAQNSIVTRKEQIGLKESYLLFGV